jgi:hypothetical protein
MPTCPPRLDICSRGGQESALLAGRADRRRVIPLRVSAASVVFQNSVEFEWPDSVKSIPGFDTSGATRQAWVECKKAPTSPSDPESGC